MDQDELEEEIFTKTIGVHLKILSDYIRSQSMEFNSMFVISHRREFFMYFLAVLVAVFVWLIHSGFLAKRFSSLDFISKTIGSQVWQETEKSGGASGNFLLVGISLIIVGYYKRFKNKIRKIYILLFQYTVFKVEDLLWKIDLPSQSHYLQ